MTVEESPRSGERSDALPDARTGADARTAAVDTPAMVLARATKTLSQTPAALITDIDGTISPIVSRPEDAAVSEAIKAALRSISGRLALTAVTTGRPEAVARSMVEVERVTYIGHYGLDAEAESKIDDSPLKAAKGRVLQTIEPLDGVVFEEKGVSFSLHYRHSPDPESAREALLAIAAEVSAATGARVVPGKQVVELVPSELPHKGTAISKLLAAHGIQGAVYFGDDISDLDAFAVLTQRGAASLPSLSIAVIDVETDERVRESADLRLAGVDQVEEVLTALAQSLQASGKR